MGLREELQTLYEDYMDEENEDGSADAAAYYVEMHPRILAALDASGYEDEEE